MEFVKGGGPGEKKTFEEIAYFFWNFLPFFIEVHFISKISLHIYLFLDFFPLYVYSEVVLILKLRFESVGRVCVWQDNLFEYFMARQSCHWVAGLSQAGWALCVQMDFTRTFDANKKCNNKDHVWSDFYKLLVIFKYDPETISLIQTFVGA